MNRLRSRSDARAQMGRALWQSKGVCSYLCPSLSPSLCQSPSFPKERAWGPNLSHSNPGAKSKLSFVVLGSQQLPITGSAWLLGLSLPQHGISEGCWMGRLPCCWWKTSSAIELNKYVLHGCFIPQNLHSNWHGGFLHPRCQKCLASCISTSFRCCPCISCYAPSPAKVVHHHHEPPPSFSYPLVSSKDLWWLWICNDHLRVQSLHKSIRWMGVFRETTHPRDRSERRYFPVLPAIFLGSCNHRKENPYIGRVRRESRKTVEVVVQVKFVNEVIPVLTLIWNMGNFGAKLHIFWTLKGASPKVLQATTTITHHTFSPPSPIVENDDTSELPGGIRDGLGVSICCHLIKRNGVRYLIFYSIIVWYQCVTNHICCGKILQKIYSTTHGPI